ncbi:sugar ABC transporter permease [Spiractinospora alimapuensis]|uniref:carbohydrate ABC transporter permease n=1 Tax=Spiractinospora alimapuensis TaxID=2820884 RepID=UPI001F32C976|nr:sugar ABC transporter permease [Spiractinospora alimapuensis]QVQ51754.1 sugar ABC transporter permease [Spiractinospora alimapuensis]
MSVAVPSSTRTERGSPAPGPDTPRVSRRRRALRPYLLAVPAVLLCVGILYPFFLGASYTLFDFSAQNPDPDMVGAENYTTILTSAAFWNSARVTAIYAIGATVVETVLGVGIALLLNRSTILGRMLERVVIIPLMVAPVVAAIMWRLLLNPEVGWVAPIAGWIGLTHTGTDSPVAAMVWTIVVDVWIFTPFVTVIALAGLSSLPSSPFEAAAVDGAGWWMTFRRLTLPMLWPYLLVAVIFRLMDSVKMFDVIYSLTSGGPGSATTSMSIQAYQEAITYARYSRGLTYMLLLWAVVFVVSMILVRYLRRIQSRAAGV